MLLKDFVNYLVIMWALIVYFNEVIFERRDYQETSPVRVAKVAGNIEYNFASTYFTFGFNRIPSLSEILSSESFLEVKNPFKTFSFLFRFVPVTRKSFKFKN